MQDQLCTFGGNLSSEHALSEQISDLREVRATVRERLHATETSLAEARNEVAALQFNNQEQSRRIVTLETIATRAQSQPAETPQTLLRIQELESQNRNLESEIVTLRKEAADISSQFQQSSTDAREVNERLAATQEELEAANRRTVRLQEEKSTSERQAVFEQEQLRKELSTTANMQLEYMKDEHMETIQQVRLEKFSAEEKLKNVTKQLNALKVENQKSEKEVGSLKEALSRKEAAIGSVKALELHLKEMEVRMRSKDNEYSDLQVMLSRANDQVKVKESEIMALQVSQATRASSSRAGEHRSSIRGAQSTQKGHSLHRDPSHVLIDQNPSVQTANPVSSKLFTNRPAIVEDSQPTDKQAFVSLDDLILEDPFAGYAREGSQTIAGEDMSHLFPSTPGAGSRVKDLDYSQNSVYHTTVVSETQRRQNQSFRTATPHTGTHATNKSHFQSQMRTHSMAAQSYAMPKPSAAISPTNFASRHHVTNAPSSQREASITRESTQPQGSVNDPRQGKRNNVAAGFNDTKSQARPSKVQKPNHLKQPKNLGPIIEDSQSPLLNGRSRKIPRRTSTAPKGEAPTQDF